MKFILVGFLFACFIVFLDGRKHRFRDDYTYLKSVEGYMKYHEIPSNWHEAMLRCHMEGAVLASPLTKLLREAMVKLFNHTDLFGVHTGIHARFSRGDFHSIEGEPDNNNNEESCIAMMNDGSFADLKCEKTLPYICYKKFTPGMVMNGCGTIDNGYNLDTRTGSCYKFHQFPRTWSRAFMTCTAEGGYLAIINSETEAQLIKELYAKNPAINGVGDYWTLAAFIGVHDWDEHGEWRTIHGESLKTAGYDKFSPGEPNNLTSQYCGSVYRNGMFDDMWCHRRAAFICEKDPATLTCDDDDEENQLDDSN